MAVYYSLCLSRRGESASVILLRARLRVVIHVVIVVNVVGCVRLQAVLLAVLTAKVRPKNFVCDKIIRKTNQTKLTIDSKKA